MIKTGFARGTALLAAFPVCVALSGSTPLSAQAGCGGGRYTIVGLMMGDAIILDQLSGTIYRCPASGFNNGCVRASRIPA